MSVIGTCLNYDMHQCDDGSSFYFEHCKHGDESSVKYTIENNAIIDVEETVSFTVLMERHFVEAMRKINPALTFDYLSENWRSE